MGLERPEPESEYIERLRARIAVQDKIIAALVREIKRVARRRGSVKGLILKSKIGRPKSYDSV